MKCVVCLCVYNSQVGLPYCFDNIKQMAQCFDVLDVIVFYDESTDNSLPLLQDFKTKYNHSMNIIINKKPKSHLRTANIAVARNSMLDSIREGFVDYNYFIMMDTNEYACIGNINIHVLQSVLDNDDSWDAISFDREAGYYDTWALSFDPYIYSFFHFNNWPVVVNNMRLTFNRLLDDYKINRPNDLIPVYSAFNGFAIYKTNKFLNCSYSSTIHPELFPANMVLQQINLTGDNIVPYLYDDCEHRKFHLEAIRRNDARVMICTQSLFSKFKNPPPNLRGPA